MISRKASELLTSFLTPASVASGALSRKEIDTSSKLLSPILLSASVPSGMSSPSDYGLNINEQHLVLREQHNHELPVELEDLAKETPNYLDLNNASERDRRAINRMNDIGVPALPVSKVEPHS